MNYFHEIFKKIMLQFHEFFYIMKRKREKEMLYIFFLPVIKRKGRSFIGLMVTFQRPSYSKTSPDWPLPSPNVSLFSPSRNMATPKESIKVSE